MNTVNFDTLEATRRLREAGMGEQEAAAVVRTLTQAQTHLVTQEHFDARLSVLDAKMDKLAWMMGVLVAIALANFARQFF